MTIRQQIEQYATGALCHPDSFFTTSHKVTSVGSEDAESDSGVSYYRFETTLSRRHEDGTYLDVHLSGTFRLPT